MGQIDIRIEQSYLERSIYSHKIQQFKQKINDVTMSNASGLGFKINDTMLDDASSIGSIRNVKLRIDDNGNENEESFLDA